MQREELTALIKAELRADMAVELLRMQQSLQQQPSSSSRPPRTKAEAPKAFDSMDSKYTVHDFLFHLESYFTLSSVQTDQECVTYAGTRMYGPALTWFRSLSLPMTYADFKEALLHEYRPVHEVQNARDRLHALRMDGSNLRAYTQRFRSLCYKIPDLSASEKFDRYFRGLTPFLQREIRVRNITSFEDAVQLSDHLLSSVSSTSGFKPSGSDRKGTERGYSRPSSYRAPNPSGPAPMELGTMAPRPSAPLSQADKDRLKRLQDDVAKPDNRKKLEQADRDFLQRVGGCFACRQLGHTSRDNGCKLASKNRQQGQQRR